MNDTIDPQQAILDSLAEGVITVDEQWNITSFNRAAEQITGITREEAMGQKCFNVMQSPICQQHCLLRESLDQEGLRVNRHTRLRHRAGQEVPVSITGTALRSRDGRPAGGVATFRDQSVEERLQRTIQQRHKRHDMVGKSHQLRSVLDVLPGIAEGGGPVLLQGPAGTGKQLLARAIHHLSPRQDGAFVSVNCGTLPETLLESELFGHVRGALPGAKHDRQGRVQGAAGGTLLLKQIGGLSARLQQKLLGVIDESRFQPLGAAESQRADVRIVVATLAPLEPEVAAGRFNPELFARLRSVTITLPPLADRREDIPQLVQHFIGQLNDQHGTHVRGISADALQRLMRHPLPENIRQLRNIVEYAMVMCRTDCIELDCLPGELDRIAPDESRAKPLDPLAQAEADAIRQALHKFAGHRGRTAEALGIDKSTLWRKMKRHGIRFP